MVRAQDSGGDLAKVGALDDGACCLSDLGEAADGAQQHWVCLVVVLPQGITGVRVQCGGVGT